MFCTNCGAEGSGAYCGKCGISRATTPTTVGITLSDVNFCTECGLPIKAAYCTACGRHKDVKFKFSGMPTLMRPSVHAETPPIPNSLALPAVKSSFELCLNIIILCLALGELLMFSNVFSILVLACAVVPVVLSEYMSDLYNKSKHIINSSCAGLGFLFAIIFLVRTNSLYNWFPKSFVLMFMLWTIGLLIIAALGLRDRLNINLPKYVERILDGVEGRWSIVTVTGYIVGASLITKLLYNFGYVFSFIFSGLLLVSVLCLAYAFEKNDARKQKIWLWALIASSVIVTLRFIFFRGGGMLQVLFALVGLGIVIYLAVMNKKLLFGDEIGSALPVNSEALTRVFSASQPEVGAPSDGSFAPSRFHGGIGGIIGIRILGFFITMIVIVICMRMTAVAFDASFEMGIIMLLASIIAVVFVTSIVEYMLIRWEVTSSEIDNFKLGFGAGLTSFVLLKLKIALLNIITLNWYAILGGAQTAVIRWKTRSINGATHQESHFGGRWYSLFGINFGCGLLYIVSYVSIWSIAINSISGRGRGTIENAIDGVFSNPLWVLNDPFGYAGGMVESFINYALGAFVFATILSVVVSFVVGALQRYNTIKFEINNSIVSSRQWTFSGTLGGLMAIVIVNMLLTIVTFGAYNLLGFPHLLMTRYKMENVRPI